jgi:hypothetical protein
LLCFEDTYFERFRHAHPQQEGEYVSELLSLIYDTTIDVIGYSTGEIDCSEFVFPKAEDNGYASEESGEIAGQCLSSILKCDEVIAKQFIRSIHAYSLALRSMKFDIALAFVVLVTAVEALSSRTEVIPAANAKEKDQRKAERFCEFVHKYCENSVFLEGHTETTAREDLKTIYYVSRSAFLHGGAEISLGASLADKSGMRSFPVIIDGKEKFIPGVRWFQKTVRSSLIGFIKTFPDSGRQMDEDLLPRIASARGIVTISASRFAPGQQSADDRGL